MDILLYYTLGFAFLIGAAIGSFLNVVIYRVPEGLSVVSPASRCPSCKSEIRWYDNIPILSWLWLRGKCRRCGWPISFRYAFVELLTGLVAAFLWYQRFAPLANAKDVVFDSTALAFVLLPTILYFIFCCLLIVITFVDFDHFLIPHEFTIPGMIIGLAAPWIYKFALGDGYVLYFWPPITPMASIVGFLAGGLIIIVVFYGYLAVRGIEGMGGGDVTLMAMVGAWLGFPSLVFVLFAASFQGLLAAGLTSVLGIEFVKDSAEIFDDDDAAEVDEPEVEVVDADTETETDTDDYAQDADVEGAADADVDSDAGVDVDVDADADADQQESASDPQSDDESLEEEVNEYEGKAAIPFGPFISLAAAEYLLFGLYLPPEISLLYLFY